MNNKFISILLTIGIIFLLIDLSGYIISDAYLDTIGFHVFVIAIFIISLIEISIMVLYIVYYKTYKKEIYYWIGFGLNFICFIFPIIIIILIIFLNAFGYFTNTIYYKYL